MACQEQTAPSLMSVTSTGFSFDDRELPRISNTGKIDENTPQAHHEHP
jgi:hypothetical protein